MAPRISDVAKAFINLKGAGRGSIRGFFIKGILFVFLLIGYTFSGIALSQNQYEYHIRLAKEYVAKAQWDKAIEEYTKAISLKPNDAHLYYARGLTHLLKLHTVLKIKNIDLPRTLHDLRTLKEGIDEYEKGLIYKNAIEDFTKAIELEPINGVFYWLRGTLYYSSGKNEDAIKDLNKAINLKTNIALFFYERGRVYAELEEYKKAINDFSKAISIKPDSRDKLYSLFVKPYERVFDFNVLKGYDPEQSPGNLRELYRSRGLAYEKDGQLGMAIKDYEQATLLGDSFSSPLLLYNLENKLPEGIKFYSKAISLYPKRADLYEGRALIYLTLKQYDKALKDFTKAIELEPEEASLYSFRGGVYVNLKKYDEAIKDYTKLIELNPKDPSAYFSRGNVYVELKKYDEAIKDYTKVIELVPYYADAYASRGDVYLLINQSQKARADYEKACSLAESFCKDLETFERHEKFLKKAEEMGKNWIYLGSSNTGKSSYYYDKTRIKIMPNKHIRVWVRLETDDVNALIEKRKRKYLPTEGYENFSHTLVLFEIDCINEKGAEISFVDYDSEGRLLYEYHIPEKEVKMTPIIPNSSGDILSKIVCKKEAIK